MLRIMIKEKGKRRHWSEFVAPTLIVAVGALLYWGTTRPAPTRADILPHQRRLPFAAFALPDLNGKIWKLNDHRGRVVLVNFWATWCPPCQSETPGLVNLAKRYKGKGFDVVGINMDQGGTQSVQQFVNEYKIPYPILIPRLDSPFSAEIQGLPTSLLLDRQGKVAKVYVGAASEADLGTNIRPLLTEK